MPATALKISNRDSHDLARLGARIRQARRQQKVSAVAAAEAAGLSRVTLHRIERGEPSVAMSSWLALANAVGLAFALVDPSALPPSVELPARIRLDRYPRLQKLAWQLKGVDDLPPKDALALYERNWRHVDVAGLTEEEAALIRALSSNFGGGKLLV